MRKLEMLLAFGLLLMMSMVSAAIFIAPESSGTIRGTTANFTVLTDMKNVSNCSITCSSTWTGDSFTALLLNTSVYPESGDNRTAALVDSWQALDSSDWTCTGTCYNATYNDVTGGSESITAITGVTVDNTKPLCAFDSALLSNTQYLPDQTWSVTGYNATSASIVFGTSNPYTMNEVADVFTYTGTITEGTYATLTATTSDGTNTTDCALTSVRIESDSMVQKIAVATSGDMQQKSGGLTGNSGILLIGAAAVALYLFNKKK